jgi:hypothetical protein
MNPNDIFWLARYAHRQLTPLMAPLDCFMKIDLHFGAQFPGVDVWFHSNDRSDGRGVVIYRTGITSQREMNKFIVQVQALASVTA